MLSSIMEDVPSAPSLLLERSKLLFELEDFPESIADAGRYLKVSERIIERLFKDSVKHFPSSLEALQLRGDAHFSLGEFDLAGRHYREGLKVVIYGLGLVITHASSSILTMRTSKYAISFAEM